MLILAAIEHHARHIWATVTEAITECHRGFSDREAGDFLTVTERARQQLVEREEMEEVAEPSWASDVSWHPLTRRTIEDAYWCYEHGVIRSLCIDMHPQSSAVIPPVAEVAPSVGAPTGASQPAEGGQPNLHEAFPAAQKREQP